jgi:hypothetical protein
VKFNITILFLFLLNAPKGQSIRFQLIRKDICTRLSHVDSTSYTLIDKLHYSSYIAMDQSRNGIMTLPGFGTYYIDTYYLDSLFTNIKIEIKDTGLFKYTFIEPKLTEEICPLIVDPFLQYISCGQLANGYQEDFFANGNIKIRGTFNKGYPLDSVVKFYSNGITKTRTTYLKKWKVIEKYDSLFNLTELSKYKKDYWLPDYQKKFFYTDNRIKLSENRKHGVITLKEFFMDGSLKTIQTAKKRIEYYPDHKVACIFHWKKVKDQNTNDYKFVISKTAFGLSNKTEEEQVYEYWINGSKMMQPELDINRADWIVIWKKVKDGLEETICEDISTAEYIKKN